MSATPTRGQVLKLYKQFMRNARQFNDYNFREYFIRRARIGFKENRDVQDSQKLNTLFKDAQRDLGVLKRQSVLSQMYTFDKLVVEPLNKNHGHSRGL